MNTAPPPKLKPGDVISYSAGTTSSRPDGFRVVRKGANLLASIARLSPPVLRLLEGRLPMLVNAYPAPVAEFSAGVLVDTYLSPRTASRAMHLAATSGMTVILAGQPLFLAEALLCHERSGAPWSAALLLVSGGYPMPASLERFLLAFGPGSAGRSAVVHLYGAAEVDAGCLVATARNPHGELVYFPRDPGIVIQSRNSEIHLAVRGSDGEEPALFPTGDSGRPEGDGWVISNPRRYAPDVIAFLESWKDGVWRRRTGWVLRSDSGAFLAQTRAGVPPDDSAEMDFFEFARRTGMSWLRKPDWSDAT